LYLSEHSISYIQSLDIRKLIRKRKYDEDRKPLLAFGGAIYEDSGFKAEMIENRVQLAVLTKNIYSNLENIQMDLLMKNLYPILVLKIFGLSEMPTMFWVSPHGLICRKH